MSKVPIFQVEEQVPKELGELTFASCDIFEDEKLGVRFRYERGVTKADIYLYHLGLPSISPDLRSDQVMGFFQQACSDIFTVAKSGMYRDVETLVSRYFPLLGRDRESTHLWAAFRYLQGPHALGHEEEYRYSHIFLRTDAGYINKVRYTYPEHSKKQNSEDMIVFMLAWMQAVEQALSA